MYIFKAIFVFFLNVSDTYDSDSQKIRKHFWWQKISSNILGKYY